MLLSIQYLKHYHRVVVNYIDRHHHVDKKRKHILDTHSSITFIYLCCVDLTANKHELNHNQSCKIGYPTIVIVEKEKFGVI